ncbi:hypothetical protein [Enterococcus sp. AZ109]|uniref:hypothetical protein n=1 Tax=Enterococcus sp. AZ109 TaxID=2774634 RepID=UPI003F29CFF3
MIYLIMAIPMIFVVCYVLYGVKYELVQQQLNKNDERWQSVVAKADSIALTTFYIVGIVMAGITLASDLLKRFDFIRDLLSRENLFALYKWYTLFILCVVFAVRTYSLKRYDQEM